jgi:glycerol-3-phosphate dehydrogenase
MSQIEGQKKIVIFGSGSFGTALSYVLAKVK